MNHNVHVQEAIDFGYDFKIGEYFSKGLDFFKQKPLEFLGYTVLSVVISLVINFIPILGFIISIIVTPALAMGVPIVCHMIDREVHSEFGNFFDGFKKLTPLVVAYLLTLVIYLIVALPFIFIFGFSMIAAFASGDPDSIMESTEALASMGIWIMLMGLIFAYVAISIRWTLLLVYFYDYDAVEAIKTSWKITNKKWFYHFGFMLLTGLLMMLGVLALLIGILFVIPIYQAADYAGFADVTKLNHSDEIDEIGVDEGII